MPVDISERLSEIIHILSFLRVLRSDVRSPAKSRAFLWSNFMEAAQATTTVLGWGEILKIVLASGVVAALIGVGKDWFFKSLERKHEAKFAAIGLLAKLDLYVIQSRRNLWAYREAVSQLVPERDYQEWPSCRYPEMEISDEALRRLSPEHASDLAWIATDKALATEHLSAVHESSFDPTVAYDHEARVVGYFGYEAYLLSNRLREKYDLPPFGLRWGVDDDFEDLRKAWTRTKKEVVKRSQPITASDL